MNEIKDTRVGFFITPHDIYDSYGNGGVKVSQRNLLLLKKYFSNGRLNVCTFRARNHANVPSTDLYFGQPSTNWEKLIVALLGYQGYYPWQEKKILKIIREKRTDMVFIDKSIFGKLIKHGLTCKTVVFFHNVEADYAWNKVKKEGIRYLPLFWASKINEKYTIKNADRICCLNKRDAERIKDLYGRDPDFYLPVTFEDIFDPKKAHTNYKREILFFGSLFPPNQQAVEWFIENVMLKLDDITLNIVGKGFESKREIYEKYRNVKVIGSVRESEEYYYQHAVVVMPIQYGAGMKVKTAEAMMCGRIIMASNEALEGYDVEGVTGIYRCNTANEYIEKIKYIFDGYAIPAYQSEVRECFLGQYDTGRLEDKFMEMMDTLYAES